MKRHRIATLLLVTAIIALMLAWLRPFRHELTVFEIVDLDQRREYNSDAKSKPVLMQNSADNTDVVAADQSFADCIAEGAHFDGATLTRVSFIRCDLYWATFMMARLTDVTFEDCDLRGSDFTEVVFSNCRFVNCDVGTDAVGGQTQFDDVDLSTVQFVDCIGR